MEVNVLDVGCGPHGDFDSLEFLAGEFRPWWAIGLDPRVKTDCYDRDGSVILKIPVAAWDRPGTVDFEEAGLRSVTFESGESDGGAIQVQCVDIARLVRIFAPVVLKIDAEGAEYRLLEHILDDGSDECVELAWIEWHGDTDRAYPLIERMRCDYREWTY